MISHDPHVYSIDIQAQSIDIPHKKIVGIRRVSNPSTGIILIQNAGFVRDNGTN